MAPEWPPPVRGRETRTCPLTVPKFPEPDQAKFGPLRRGTDLVPVSGSFWRLYFRGGPHPSNWNTFRTFGPTGARFDHHNDPPRRDPHRSILYAAREWGSALAEVFQETRTIDRRRHSPRLTRFTIVRQVELLDLLDGTWATRAGASAAISTGPRSRARRWSRAIYRRYPGVDGLRYGSSMDRYRESIALYDRAEDALPAKPDLDLSLADRRLLHLLEAAARTFGYLLI